MTDYTTEEVIEQEMIALGDVFIIEGGSSSIKLSCFDSNNVEKFKIRDISEDYKKLKIVMNTNYFTVIYSSGFIKSREKLYATLNEIYDFVKGKQKYIHPNELDPDNIIFLENNKILTEDAEKICEIEGKIQLKSYENNGGNGAWEKYALVMMGSESIQIILKGKKIIDDALKDEKGIYVNPFFLSEFMNGIEDKEMDKDSTDAIVTAEINSKLSLIQGNLSDGEEKFIKIINLLLDSEINIQFGDNFEFVLSPDELDSKKHIDLYEKLFNKRVGKLAHRQARMRYIFRESLLLGKIRELNENGKVIIGKKNQNRFKFNYTNGVLAYITENMAAENKPILQTEEIKVNNNILEITVPINRSELVKILKDKDTDKKINLDLVLNILKEDEYISQDSDGKKIYIPPFPLSKYKVDKDKIDIRFYSGNPPREIMRVNKTNYVGGSRTNKRSNKRSNKRKSQKRKSQKRKSNKKKSQKRKSTRRRKVRKSKRY